MQSPSSIATIVFFLFLSGCRPNPYKQGERLYSLYCANCHMEDGNGLLSLYPPLNTQEFRRFSPYFACIVNKGLTDTLMIASKEFIFPMPAQPELNNIVIANIYNYIVYKWHPDLPPTTAIQVERDLEGCDTISTLCTGK